MNSFFDKISDYLNRIAIFVAIICLLIMVLTLLVGVFFRYVMNDALTWSDEIALLSFSWSIFLCSSVLVREKAHASLTILIDALPSLLSRFIQKINYLLVVFFGVALLFAGWQFLEFTAGQVSPTLRYPLWIQVIPIPVSGFLIVIHAMNLFLKSFCVNHVKGGVA